MRLLSILAAALVLFALSACDSGAQTPPADETPLGTYEASIPFTSAAFVNGQPIPQKHSCDGGDVSPPLQWGDTLPDVETFAIIMDDPDTSDTFVHWVVYNLPATARTLPEGIAQGAPIEGGGLQGTNGRDKVGYSGPCPPSGTHHYKFKLYALNAALDLQAGATKQQVEQAMKGHILSYGELEGTFSR